MRYLLLSAVVLLFTIGCSQNKKSAFNSASSAKKFHQVAFVLYENFDTVLLNAAIAEVTTFYHCEATGMDPVALPSFAYYAPRYRYKADSLLKFQAGILPAKAECIVGITNKDISTTLGDKQDWGVFGLGYCPGNACVISTFRLKSGSYDQFKERFIKVVLHEVAHNMGLPHCKANEYCLMNDAKGSGATVDNERKWLCPGCQKRLSN